MTANVETNLCWVNITEEGIRLKITFVLTITDLSQNAALICLW